MLCLSLILRLFNSRRSDRTFSTASSQIRRPLCCPRLSTSPDTSSIFLHCGNCKFSIHSLGIKRITTAIGRDKAPSMSEIPHCVASSRMAERALPPKKMMRTCPTTVTMLMPMKNQFLCSPSKTLSLLSRRRLLLDVLVEANDYSHHGTLTCIG
jgi:hypothetical protein